ncbi:MAG TPA: UDP-N-acetylglucosamine 2-epimerase (non-hydrolyzing) [Clostridia bacterium]|nr:UDP-N-acetylglucosamine 2-epimerase (non-hydrolyzing) [Clostridia bacterium]
MNKIKVLMIFGTRPEAVKMAPLQKALSESDLFDCRVCVTAQHRGMLDQVLDIFKIVPDYDLDIMKSAQTLSYITTGVLNGVDQVIKTFRPDIALVHGDTTTSFGSALAAFYNQIPVGHVEAGLRSYDIYSPFPEEINRRLTGQIAAVHFAPTPANRENLLRENIKDHIYVTGNTVIDAMKTTVKKDYRFESETLRKISGHPGKIILMTAHRRENIGEPLKNICRAVKKVAQDNKDVKIVYPVHPNPAVLNTAREILGNLENVTLCEPLNINDMHNIMARSYLVLTDSGGLQEESPALGVPVLVLRTETERPEAVEAGTVKMAGTEENTIYTMAQTLLRDRSEYEKMARAVNPYGDGRACERIRRAILHYFGKGDSPEEFR